VLTVSGTRDGEFGSGAELNFYVRERFYGAFRRSITLPEGTIRDQIQAGFDDGLVEIIVDGVGERTEAASRIQLRDRSGAATTRTVS
jgi:HSP20 family protein